MRRSSLIFVSLSKALLTRYTFYSLEPEKNTFFGILNPSFGQSAKTDPGIPVINSLIGNASIKSTNLLVTFGAI